MNTVKINKNSWHYKLQDLWGADPWERTDFCSYWRGFIIAVGGFIAMTVLLIAAFIIVIILANIIGAVTLFAFGLYSFEAETVVMFILATLFGAVLIAIFISIPFAMTALISYTKNKRKPTFDKPYSEPSIFYQKYRSWKDKVCYKIEFE